MIRRRTVLVSTGAALATLGVSAVTAGPRPALLGDPQGDEGLATALRPHLRGQRRVAVALIDRDPGRDRLVRFGAEPEFEIGSITKTVSGAVLLSAVAQGALSLTTTVGELLPEARGSAVADVQLRELASHSAGFPRLFADLQRGALPAVLLRKDPYTMSPQEVLEAGLGVIPEGRGVGSYSNAGAAFCGQLVLHTLGQDWETAVAEHVTGPLGMGATRAPTTRDALGPAPRGVTAAGLPAEPWTMAGHAPTGNVRSTLEDMVRYVRGMLEGSNPGARGLDAVASTREGDRHYAIAWVRERLRDRDLVWHNGGTGGYASFAGFDPARRTGVVILSDTAGDLPTALGRGLLSGEVTL
ncbi:beta-lactamase family protein [Brachybacterium sp. EF45031]|uniref:serine hydrolase domain-containing protein n=1 Tax=Brachybacterium sillae TaxID=2810536 RepID=UPI00217DF7D6|nr:serine hydrolase domain-containing protein [Brachybacterium sillae]MCS6712529.1 beta-lactamase family protein [Brachybacterium sillae]